MCAYALLRRQIGDAVLNEGEGKYGLVCCASCGARVDATT